MVVVAVVVVGTGGRQMVVGDGCRGDGGCGGCGGEGWRPPVLRHPEIYLWWQPERL